MDSILCSPATEASAAERLQEVRDCLESIPCEADITDYRQALLSIARIVSGAPAEQRR